MKSVRLWGSRIRPSVSQRIVQQASNGQIRPVLRDVDARWQSASNSQVGRLDRASAPGKVNRCRQQGDTDSKAVPEARNRTGKAFVGKK